MQGRPKVNPNNILPEDRFELVVRTEEAPSAFIDNYIKVVHDMRRRCWLNKKIGGVWCLSHMSGSKWKICLKFDRTTEHLFDDTVANDRDSFDVRYSNIPKSVGIDVLRGAVRCLQNPQNLKKEDIKESIDTIVLMFCEPIRLEGFLNQICTKLRRGLSFVVSDPVIKLFRNYNMLCEAYTLSCEKGMSWKDIDKSLDIKARTGCNNAEECKAILGILKPVDIVECREQVSKNNKAGKDPPGSDPGSGSGSGSGSGQEGNNKEGNQDKGKEKGKEPEGGGDRRVVVPALGFSFIVQQPWKVIKENKDLDLPAHKFMVATVRCEEIVNENYSDFTQNQVWLQREEASQFGPITGFGKNLSSLIGDCLYQYDSEAGYFDEGVRTFKRKHLEEKLFQLVQPAFHSILGHLRSGMVEKFKKPFDKALNMGEGFSTASNKSKQTLNRFDERCGDAVIEQAKWNTSKIKLKLVCHFEEYIASFRAAKFAVLSTHYEAKNEALAGPDEALLDCGNDDTWPSIKELHQQETQSAVAWIARYLSGFDLDEESRDKMLTRLEVRARGLVEGKAKEEAGKFLIRTKDRFTTLSSRDYDSMPWVWTGKEDMKAITKLACSSSLKLLSVLAVALAPR